MCRLIILFCFFAWGFPASALSVVFLNPGKSDELYWLSAARAMESAAKSLDIHFEVLYAEREHLRSFDHVRALIARPPAQRPDFVIFSNDYATGPEVVRQLDAAGIKVFMAYSGRGSSRDAVAMGRPRERFKHWIGSLEPHAEEAGYLTGKALIAKGRAMKAFAPDGRLHMIAIGGDRSTPTSIRRSAGMRQAVAEAGDVVLDQEVFAAWRHDKAAEQSEWLYLRYPGARLIWSGNDLMAFGAIESWEKRGGKAGQDAWFSGINTSAKAMEMLKSGRLTALAGGHFIAGAWALVLIHDYAKGKDFSSEGLELNQSMFTLFTPSEVERYQERFGQMNFDSIDFRRFSKIHNPQLQRYNFSFRPLLY